VGIDLGRKEVEVDDALVALRVPQVGVVLHHVVADGHDHVGRVHGTRHEVLRLESDGEERAGIVHVDAPLRHERTDDPDAAALGELPQLRTRPLPYRAISRQNDRTRRGANHLEGTVYDRVVGNRTAHPLGRDRLYRGLSTGNVLGQLDVTCAGLLRRSELEGLAHDLRDVVRVDHALRPARHRAHHGDHIHRLVALLVESLAVGLPGNDHERRPVHVGIGDAGDQVRRAGTQRPQTDAGLTGQPPVDFRHEGGPLLVTREDELDGRVLEGHHQIGVLLTRNAKDLRHPLGLEAADEEIGSLHGPPSPGPGVKL
jgi:hypothetical protein